VRVRRGEYARRNLPVNRTERGEWHGFQNPGDGFPERRLKMAESVYKVIELVGTSTESWEKAATAAVAKASEHLRDLRVAEVSELDMQLDEGQVRSYRAKVKVSFKYEGGA
jgi:flavin-binding protein dodecin